MPTPSFLRWLIGQQSPTPTADPVSFRQRQTRAIGPGEGLPPRGAPTPPEVGMPLLERGYDDVTAAELMSSLGPEARARATRAGDEAYAYALAEFGMPDGTVRPDAIEAMNARVAEIVKQTLWNELSLQNLGDGTDPGIHGGARVQPVTDGDVEAVVRQTERSGVDPFEAQLQRQEVRNNLEFLQSIFPRMKGGQPIMWTRDPAGALGNNVQRALDNQASGQPAVNPRSPEGVLYQALEASMAPSFDGKGVTTLSSAGPIDLRSMFQNPADLDRAVAMLGQRYGVPVGEGVDSSMRQIIDGFVQERLSRLANAPRPTVTEGTVDVGSPEMLPLSADVPAEESLALFRVPEFQVPVAAPGSPPGSPLTRMETLGGRTQPVLIQRRARPVDGQLEWDDVPVEGHSVVQFSRGDSMRRRTGPLGQETFDAPDETFYVVSTPDGRIRRFNGDGSNPVDMTREDILALRDQGFEPSTSYVGSPYLPADRMRTAQGAGTPGVTDIKAESDNLYFDSSDISEARMRSDMPVSTVVDDIRSLLGAYGRAADSSDSVIDVHPETARRLLGQLERLDKIGRPGRLGNDAISQAMGMPPPRFDADKKTLFDPAQNIRDMLKQMAASDEAPLAPGAGQAPTMPATYNLTPEQAASIAGTKDSGLSVAGVERLAAELRPGFEADTTDWWNGQPKPKTEFSAGDAAVGEQGKGGAGLATPGRLSAARFNIAQAAAGESPALRAWIQDHYTDGIPIPSQFMEALSNGDPAAYAAVRMAEQQLSGTEAGRVLSESAARQKTERALDLLFDPFIEAREKASLIPDEKARKAALEKIAGEKYSSGLGISDATVAQLRDTIQVHYDDIVKGYRQRAGELMSGMAQDAGQSYVPGQRYSTAQTLTPSGQALAAEIESALNVDQLTDVSRRIGSDPSVDPSDAEELASRAQTRYQELMNPSDDVVDILKGLGVRNPETGGNAPAATAGRIRNYAAMLDEAPADAAVPSGNSLVPDIKEALDIADMGGDAPYGLSGYVDGDAASRVSEKAIARVQAIEDQMQALGDLKSPENLARFYQLQEQRDALVRQMSEYGDGQTPSGQTRNNILTEYLYGNAASRVDSAGPELGDLGEESVRLGDRAQGSNPGGMARDSIYEAIFGTRQRSATSFLRLLDPDVPAEELFAGRLSRTTDPEALARLQQRVADVRAFKEKIRASGGLNAAVRDMVAMYASSTDVARRLDPDRMGAFVADMIKRYQNDAAPMRVEPTLPQDPVPNPVPGDPQSSYRHFIEQGIRDLEENPSAIPDIDAYQSAAASVGLSAQPGLEQRHARLMRLIAEEKAARGGGATPPENAPLRQEVGTPPEPDAVESTARPQTDQTFLYRFGDSGIEPGRKFYISPEDPVTERYLAEVLKGRVNENIRNNFRVQDQIDEAIQGALVAPRNRGYRAAYEKASLIEDPAARLAELDRIEADMLQNGGGYYNAEFVDNLRSQLKPVKFGENSGEFDVGLSDVDGVQKLSFTANGRFPRGGGVYRPTSSFDVLDAPVAGGPEKYIELTFGEDGTPTYRIVDNEAGRYDFGMDAEGPMTEAEALADVTPEQIAAARQATPQTTAGAASAAAFASGRPWASETPATRIRDRVGDLADEGAEVPGPATPRPPEQTEPPRAPDPEDPPRTPDPKPDPADTDPRKPKQRRSAAAAMAVGAAGIGGTGYLGSGGGAVTGLLPSASAAEPQWASQTEDPAAAGLAEADRLLERLRNVKAASYMNYYNPLPY